MGLNIDTGTTRPCSVRNQTKSFDDTTPIDEVVYPSIERRIITVSPLELFLFTGYNFSEDTVVLFRKVLRSAGIPAHGTSDCCPEVTVGNAVRLHSVDLPCLAFDLCNPILSLFTPGSYEFDVINASPDTVITMQKFPLQQINDFLSCKCKIPQEIYIEQ